MEDNLNKLIEFCESNYFAAELEEYGVDSWHVGSEILNGLTKEEIFTILELAKPKLKQIARSKKIVIDITNLYSPSSIQVKKIEDFEFLEELLISESPVIGIRTRSEYLELLKSERLTLLVSSEDVDDVYVYTTDHNGELDNAKMILLS